MSHQASKLAPAGPPTPFDPSVAAALAITNERLPADAFTVEKLPLLREGLAAMFASASDLSGRRDAFQIEERAVPGPEGAPDVPLLICLPKGPAAPTAAIYNIHGGGMMVGDNRLGIGEVLNIATELRLAVISVEYRLAPETPHPGPVEDCYAGLVWTAEHAAQLNIDRDRILVMGASAGGGLAAAVALIARDRGGPALLGQVLMYPMLDDRNDTPSAVQMAGLGVWDRASNQTGWTALLGEAQGGPDVSPYAAPARATDLSGLPPAFIDVGSAETFRDEAIAYASRIWQASGQAELHVWPGGCHGFDEVAPQARISRDARAARSRWLWELLEA